MKSKKLASYDPKKIEGKWQKEWSKKKTFEVKNNKGKKKMILVEFPFPSGAGLHMGHMRPFIAGDVTSKYFRLRGFNTMYPIGWDAFGLPAENFAIKNKVHPKVSTAKNIANAKKQLLSWGTGYDWSREINTTDPEYYKWTQKLFLEFYKAGLAYEKFGEVNWCPKDKTGLANEEVIDGKCERCGTLVEKKNLRQWYLKITDYAEKLLEGLKELPEWPDSVKLQQENWIGKSEGVNLKCKIRDIEMNIEMYDSIPQTFFAQTFAVIGPDHKLLKEIVKGVPNESEILKFADEIVKKKRSGGFDHLNSMEGIFTGRYIHYPAGDRDIPLWVASYAVSDYGTGIVSCSAHDERDFAFAKKFNIPLKTVLYPENNEGLKQKVKNLEVFYREPDGVLDAPEKFKGRKWYEVRKDVIDYLVENNFADRKINYKLRDWVFSRQRYWGEPIPLIHCDKCGIVPVPEKDLPVKLPEVKNYEPTGTGESPLAAIDKWVNVKCPKCKGKAKRETNTMPQWAGSSWYWLRYMDAKNKKEVSSLKSQKYWAPVDLYFGGMEHTTLHLLYSRFWNLFLYDRKLVSVKEPYKKRVPHGIILGPDGEKMSKSRGNVVNPDEVIAIYGADTVRLYMMFLGPHGAQIAWNDKGIVGTRRFLDRVWAMKDFVSKEESNDVTVSLHKTIKKVGEDIESFSFNTAVSAMMIFVNTVYETKSITKKSYESFLTLLSIFAPHIVEEIWSNLGNKKSVFTAKWPKYNEKYLKSDKVTVVVQVNGKVRAELSLDIDIDDDSAKKMALENPKIQELVKESEIKRVIVVKNRLINIVI